MHTQMNIHTSHIDIQVNINVYIDEYAGMLSCKDNYPSMYAYTDK
jgi:hypothetical protein